MDQTEIKPTAFIDNRYWVCTRLFCTSKSLTNSFYSEDFLKKNRQFFLFQYFSFTQGVYGKVKLSCVCHQQTDRIKSKRKRQKQANRVREKERLTLTIRYSLAIYFAFCYDIVVKLFFFFLKSLGMLFAHTQSLCMMVARYETGNGKFHFVFGYFGDMRVCMCVYGLSAHFCSSRLLGDDA